MSTWHFLMALAAPLTRRLTGDHVSEPAGADGKTNGATGRLRAVGVEVRHDPPFSVPPADTDYEYAFRFASFTGEVDGATPVIEARTALTRGKPLSAPDGSSD